MYKIIVTKINDEYKIKNATNMQVSYYTKIFEKIVDIIVNRYEKKIDTLENLLYKTPISYGFLMNNVLEENGIINIEYET